MDLLEVYTDIIPVVIGCCIATTVYSP
ncbi:hypothetical protein LCGC14_2989540, partial [marine sediment metagenome]